MLDANEPVLASTFNEVDIVYQNVSCLCVEVYEGAWQQATQTVWRCGVCCVCVYVCVCVCVGSTLDGFMLRTRVRYTI